MIFVRSFGSRRYRFGRFLIIYVQYYTSPVSGYTFSTKMETLHYLFSEMDERVLESQACADDNELHVSCTHDDVIFFVLLLIPFVLCFPAFHMQRMHTWLPDGWAIEVRAGGKKMEKMYKVILDLVLQLTSGVFC